MQFCGRNLPPCALPLHFQGLALLATPSNHGKRHWEACNTHTIPFKSRSCYISQPCCHQPPSPNLDKSDGYVAVRLGFEPMTRGVCVRCMLGMLCCRRYNNIFLGHPFPLSSGPLGVLIRPPT